MSGFSIKKRYIAVFVLNGMTDILRICYQVWRRVSKCRVFHCSFEISKEQEVKKVYFTPHIMADYPDNNPVFSKERLICSVKFVQ